MGGSMRRMISMTVCTAESTSEFPSAISHRFHNVVEKRNPYQSKNQHQRTKHTPASLCDSCNMYHIYEGEQRQYRGECTCV
jgi:hypothetical protein